MVTRDSFSVEANPRGIGGGAACWDGCNGGGERPRVGLAKAENIFGV